MINICFKYKLPNPMAVFEWNYNFFFRNRSSFPFYKNQQYSEPFRVCLLCQGNALLKLQKQNLKQKILLVPGLSLGSDWVKIVSDSV